MWTRVTRYIANWLNRPQRTRRDDLFVGLLVTALSLLGVYLVGRLLDARGLIDFKNHVPLWLAAVLIGLALVLGIVLGRRGYMSGPQTYELYAEHLRDALADLRKFWRSWAARFC